MGEEAPNNSKPPCTGRLRMVGQCAHKGKMDGPLGLRSQRPGFLLLDKHPIWVYLRSVDTGGGVESRHARRG